MCQAVAPGSALEALGRHGDLGANRAGAVCDGRILGEDGHEDRVLGEEVAPQRSLAPRGSVPRGRVGEFVEDHTWTHAPLPGLVRQSANPANPTGQREAREINARYGARGRAAPTASGSVRFFV
jgi:hypothetical protein